MKKNAHLKKIKQSQKKIINWENVCNLKTKHRANILAV